MAILTAAASQPAQSPSNFKHKWTILKPPYQRTRITQTSRQYFARLGLNLRLFFLATWLDWATIIKIALLAGTVWISPPVFERLFPVTAPDGTIYRPELAYPYVTPIFSPAGAGILAAAIPIAVFALAQFWFHSFVDFAAALLGLAYCMVTGTFFQVVLKKTIGGFRPHFLAVCQPVLPKRHSSAGTGFRNVMYTVDEVCTGDPDMVRNAVESFPSGHAEVAFAGLGYLTIYLFTHLQITSSTRTSTRYWRMLLVVAPLLLATYLTGTLLVGYHHHWYDVIFGALIGWSMAFFGYRMVFMGLIDASRNTVPYLKLRAGGGGEGEAHNMNGGVDDNEANADTSSQHPDSAV